MTATASIADPTLKGYLILAPVVCEHLAFDFVADKDDKCYTPRGRLCENAGLKVIEVNPNDTSQECSSCGQKVKKPLSQRIHNCPVCHISICRDLNASLNIKARGAHALKAQVMSPMESH
jgi:predicted RNA-binding Zn-ribbon protein involved in translation (DUF1610 family)